MIAQDILATIEHDVPVAGVWIGLHWTVVALADGRAGMAATLQADPTAHHIHGTPDVAEAGRLHTRGALELAAYVNGRQGPDASVGWAALNALVCHDLLDSAAHDEAEMDAAEFLLAEGQTRPVAVVGHFPFTGRLRAGVETLWVLEMDPGPDDLPADAAPDILPQAGVVALTSMTLINNTFAGLLPHIRPDAVVMLLGPSTPLTPVFFARGIDVLSGVRVTDIDMLRDSVTQGASFWQVRGVQKVTITCK
ncbi:MAG: DUF364 domain-containing protein [Anaerolineae bacterium]|nr:DUF364 domain-containing protein [Anaerolineae bacterium]